MAKYLGPRAADGTVKVHLGEDPRCFSIVGVVDDIKQIGLDTGEVPAIYFPHAQKSEDWLTWMTLVVRTSVKPEDEVNAISGSDLAGGQRSAALECCSPRSVLV